MPDLCWTTLFWRVLCACIWVFCKGFSEAHPADENAKVNALWKLSTRTMRPSVEPLCPTHNVQRRREPVYNSGNPPRKNMDGYFPTGKLLFQACSNLLQSFCQSRSVECFPSSRGYAHFPPNPSYYSLVCNMEKPRWMSHVTTANFSSLFFFFFISWSIHPTQTADWWQGLFKSAVFAVWSDRSVISPAERTHAEARGWTPLHLSAHDKNLGGGGEGGREQETKNWECLIFSGVGVAAPVIRRSSVWSQISACYMLKYPWVRMSNPKSEAALLVHEGLFLNPDWLLCHHCVKDL